MGNITVSYTKMDNISILIMFNPINFNILIITNNNSIFK